MAYTDSKSLMNLNAEIDKMISVIISAYKSKSTNSDIKDYLLSCCIMLGSAKIEVYIEDFFDSWIQKINSSGLTSASIPNNLKAIYLNQQFLNTAFKKLLIDSNESQYIDIVSNQINDNHFNLTDDSKQIPNLNSKRIYQNKKYPTPENMKTLFKRVGINNIFNELNRLAKSDIEKLLQSYNDFRTAIAHNGIPVGINEKDVIAKLRDIKKIIRYLDRVLYNYLTKDTLILTWC